MRTAFAGFLLLATLPAGNAISAPAPTPEFQILGIAQRIGCAGDFVEGEGYEVFVLDCTLEVRPASNQTMKPARLIHLRCREDHCLSGRCPASALRHRGAFAGPIAACDQAATDRQPRWFSGWLYDNSPHILTVQHPQQRHQ